MPAGELFLPNATNVARAAVRQAERQVPVDSPVKVVVASLRPSDESELVVRVSVPGGSVHEVPIDPRDVQACADEPDYATHRRMLDELIDATAARVSRAIRDALREGSTELSWGTAWEVMDAAGERVVLDVRRTGSGILQWSRSSDPGRWQRLFGIRQDGVQGRESSDDPWHVVLGLPLTVHVGFREMWTSASVISVRELKDGSALPEPVGMLDDED